MFRRHNDETVTTESERRVEPAEPRARAGVSAGPVLTGVVVAFGAMFLLAALIGGMIATTGATADGAIEASIIAGMALVAAQFLAYLWGGYTAGRMGRGAGMLHGLLVPLAAIAVAVVVGAVAAGLGESANLNMPFTVNRLPLEEDFLVDWGTGVGIASLVAMLLGGVIGGGLGERWHTRLERRRYDERLAETRPAAPATAPRTDAEATTTTAPARPAPGDTARAREINLTERNPSTR